MTKDNLFKTFLKKAHEIHGYNYDYSQVAYVNNKTKIRIRCNKCGLEFEVRPDNHLNKKSGCPKCNKQSPFKKSNTQFTDQLKEIYGNKYDYSKIEYINNHTKVCLICPIHGEFWQTPVHLLKGISCPKCSSNYHSSKEELNERLQELYPNFKFSLDNYRNINSLITFIDNDDIQHTVSLNRLLKGDFKPKLISSKEMLIKCLKDKFGNFYDYSKVEFVNRATPITLLVNETKEEITNVYPYFLSLSKPTKKIRGKLTTEKYINRCKQVYGDEYDYSKVNYVNPHTKVCIVCRVHGDFEILPFNFINGHGCPKCTKEKNRQNYLVAASQEFIKRAKVTHGNNYDYSKVDYKNNSTKVCIICPKHGEFWQAPSAHVQGHGCPICKASKLEREMRKFLIEKDLKIEEQKRFPWLGLQSLDFYLPDYNIGIECQGKQHFGLGNFGSQRFNKDISQSRDERKYRLCKENGIRLLYYSNLGIEYPYKVYEDLNELFKEIGD